MLMAFAVWLLAVPGCEQKEEEPVFKLQSPAVDVEVKKSDKGVDVEVKGKGRDE